MALQNNMDFPGSDVAQVYASDAKHCQQLCTAHPSCMFFTFVRPDWTRDNRHFYCYFKVTASGEPKIQTLIFGATSGYSLRSCTPELTEFPVYQNVDFLGADYKTLFTANYGDCQRVCTDDPFSWVRTPVEGVDFWGEDIQNRMVDSAEACQKACDEDDKCQFYTYLTEQFIDRDYRHRCFLKRTITIPAPPKIVKLQNVVSGFSLMAVP
ncbi:hypothetical protein D4764_21G0002580 [Takifugu flavidus]|uniref:Apple domain-containing protein n=1 Tax=Takifugu flavidus TaxID=433684 RepID=A0A5C6NEP9_9TELE|nr:hypothetical protein D4764_21G0002580 [Takifugu flavidus]